jgi:N-acetylglucosamine malate deacetylase 1
MNILACGAHPDDIEIGMGGTIAKYSDYGYHIIAAVGGCDDEKRTLEARIAARKLKADLMNSPGGPRFDAMTVRCTVDLFDQIIKLVEPSRIYTHWINDSHQEHRIVSQAVISASRKNRCSVYMYEPMIPGGIVPYSFRFQKYVDISEFLDSKIRSIQLHRSQVEKYPGLIEAVKARATLRGFDIGVRFAEAFEVVKEIDSIENLKPHDNFMGDTD